MKKGLKITGIVIVVLIALGLGGFLMMKNSVKNALEAMVYEDVDMNAVADGTYYGETDAGLVYVKVGVTVKDHAISGIEIIDHQNGQGGKAEAITEKMIAQNTYDVDAVSGATTSSEAIKSAVSKALNDGIQ